MKKAGLQKILRNHEKKFARLTAKISKTFSPKDIHQFRIEYKKFRSLLVLVSFTLSAKHPIKIRRWVKKIYKLSGSLRDDYLFLQKLKTLSIDHSAPLMHFAVKLKSEFRSVKKEWKKIKTRQFSSRDVIKPSDADFPRKISKALFQDYLVKNAAAIDTLVNKKSMSDSQLHFLRKIIKERSYNMSLWINIYGEKIIPRRVRSHMEELQHLMDELGIFNDLATFQVRVKELNGSNDPLKGQSVIHRVTEKVKVEKQKIYSKIVEEIIPSIRE